MAYQTMDSGVTWIQNANIIEDVEFPSDSVGYTIGWGSDTTTLTFGKTTDAGKTWIYKQILHTTPPSRSFGLVSFGFRDDMNGFITEGIGRTDGSGAGNYGFFSTDGGTTWSSRGTASSWQLLHLHDSTWLSGILNYPIGKTNNDFETIRDVGLNIIPQNRKCDIPGYVMSKSDSNNITAIYRRYNSIYRSTDAGETWYLQRCKGGDASEWTGGGLSTPTSLVGYAVGIDSQIYKTIDGGGPPFTSSVRLSPPCDCNTKISPEIASGSVTISFDAVPSAESIEIYDAIGRQVSSAQIPAEATSYRIDVSSYSSGMYLAKLRGKMYRFVKVGN